MNPLPTHVAIIMDGNRRWAARHGKSAIDGHKKVVNEITEALIDHAAKLSIPFITFWAFSTENWNRSQLEVAGIMQVFRLAIKKHGQRLIDKGARLRYIGDLTKFPPDIQAGFSDLMEKSAKKTKITVTFALNYGGRDEIIRAIHAIGHSPLAINHVTADDFSQFLDTVGMPDPDIIIRPGGEKRLSGFLPWQSEYAELYFTDTLMPDFNELELDQALAWYATRNRRFGGGAFKDYTHKTTSRK